MARYTLKIQGQPGYDGQFDRVTYYHDTETYADAISRESGLPRMPPTEVYDPAEKLGSYCKGQERVDVYSSYAQDGRSRLEFFPNDAGCTLLNPPTTGGGGEGGTTTVAPPNDPQAGLNWILLYRLYRPAKRGSIDGWDYRDRYYNPTTRLEETILSTNIYDQVRPDYFRPTTDIIDRWCVAKGEAPFTEVRVTHDGSGNAVLTPVDNVATCTFPPCGVTLTVDSLTNAGELGRGSATLLATNAEDAGIYSLGSATAVGQPTGSFPDLPVGRYLGYFREKKDNPCKASVAFRVTAPYGPRYRLFYRDFANVPCSLYFDMRGYTGPTEELLGQDAAVTLSYPAESGGHIVDNALRGSSIDIRLWIMEQNQLLDTYSADERYVRLRLVRGGMTTWQGWLQPEQYDIAHLSPPNEFNLSGTDGLGALSGVDFTDAAGNLLTGQWSALQVIMHCLNRLDLDLPLRVLDTLYPSGASTTDSPLTQFFVDIAAYRNDKGEPWSCEDVLRALLDSRGARLYQDYDAACWRWERLADLSTEPMQYVAYSADGDRLTNPPQETRLATISLPPPNHDGGPYWLEGNQRKSIRPAVQKTEVTAEPGELVNLLAEATRWAEEDFDVSGHPLGWAGSAPTSRVAPLKKNDPVALRLEGAAPGTAQGSALFVQTTPTVALVSTPNPIGPLRLTVEATVSAVGGTMPENPTDAQLPRMMVAVRQGTTWLAPGGTSETQPLLQPVTFEKEGTKVEAVIPAYTKYSTLPSPVVVRLYQVVAVGTAARYDVDITSLRLEYAAGPGAERNFQNQTITPELKKERQVITRQDKDLTLFHTDTPTARLHGTMLTADGLPTTTWFQAATPEVLRALHVYTSAYRYRWQARAAQVLLGTVRGRINPGFLFTDPQEQNPAIYLLTDSAVNDADDTTSLTAVQINTLLAPGQVLNLPSGALLLETGAPSLTQDSNYLLAEDA